MRLLVCCSLLGMAAALGANWTSAPAFTDLTPAYSGFNINFNVSNGSTVGCVVTWDATLDYTTPATFWNKVFSGSSQTSAFWGKWNSLGSPLMVEISKAAWPAYQWGRTYTVWCAVTPTVSATSGSSAGTNSNPTVAKSTKSVGCGCVAANTMDAGAICPVTQHPNGLLWAQCWCHKAYRGYNCSEVIPPVKCTRVNCKNAGGSCNTTGGYPWCDDSQLDNNGACNVCNADAANGNCTNHVCYPIITPPTPAPTAWPTLAVTVAPTKAPTKQQLMFGDACPDNDINATCSQGYCDGNGAGLRNYSTLVCRLYRDTGDACTSNFQCASLNCTSGACGAIAAGGACEYDMIHNHCGKGYYCKNNACTAQTAVGGACTLDAQCVGAALCAQVDTDTSAKCYAVFSVAAGKSVTGADSISGYAPELLCQSVSFDYDAGKCLPTKSAAEVALIGTTCKYDWECGQGGTCECTYGAGQNNGTCDNSFASTHANLIAAARVRAGLFSIESLVAGMASSPCPKGGFPFFVQLFLPDRRALEAGKEAPRRTLNAVERYEERRVAGRRTIDFVDAALLTCFAINNPLLMKQVLCEQLLSGVQGNSNYRPPCQGVVTSSSGPDADDLNQVNGLCAVANVWGVGNTIRTDGSLPAALNKPRFLVTPSCTDGVKNGNELDVDCGGSCAKCPPRAACMVASDCRSNICTSGWCGEATTCADGQLSTDETDVDCGGPCEGCAETKKCLVDWDCDTGLFCKEKICTEVASTCSNGKKDDATESDVDCGGSCPACADGMLCTKNSDCKSLCLTVFVGSSSSMQCGISSSAALRPSFMVLVLAVLCTLKSFFA